eukprot:CAMPEP_0185598376 /NCGR_PEP_ID=MMETSP0434-20130131/81953_1 /TAXON_ID=626734 ORGANISM="Favella taraikaensis, Strain Fe Narragansett Bay" /NCGR_SAMPLE_ID=MMETSP0434 /ASSEMBLY_ACC=CAM_ASM_000379 /LENGTH=65 /DNA_ID=CAMNT_0028227329 /DNA_START=949 /DNA_END=1146 /DNA_ORIENTATION=+
MNEIKAYRKQFEAVDASLKSWKPERSDSPCTPQAKRRKVFFMDDLSIDDGAAEAGRQPGDDFPFD